MKKIAHRYQVERQLQEKNLFTSYAALDTKGNRTTCINVLSPEVMKRPLQSILRYRKVQEKLKGMANPYILQVMETGQEENSDFVVHEYFDGTSLNDQNATIDEKIGFFMSVARGLEAAHRVKILHGNLNPSNILISDKVIEVKLTGFGLNLLLDLTKVTGKEEVKQVFGYLSPEGTGILRKPIDHRSDLYSLGIVFYELFTGRLPYQHEEISELIHQHIAQIPEHPTAVNPAIPTVIEKIILRLIAKDPADRYQSANGLIHDLEEYQKRRAEVESLLPIDFEIARQDRLQELTFTSKLIGREKELQNLSESLIKASQGLCGSVNVVFGEAGIGKSRLIDELRTSVHSLHGIFAGGKCYQSELRTPYKVISEALEAYVEKIKRQSQNARENIVKRIKETLGELGGEALKLVPNLKELIGELPRLVQMEPEKEKIRFLITVTNFILSLSAKEIPLLLFLDDLQWVDDGSLEILERVIEKIPESSITLIISYRSNEVDENHPLAKILNKQLDSITKFPINPFDVTQTAEMISQILMEPTNEMLHLAENLHDKTQGNPFFTLELLKSLYDEKIISLQDDHYRYDQEKLGKANLPTNVVDIVLKRIKDIPEEEKNILSYASAISKEIDLPLLGELTHKPLEELLNILEASIANQLLYRDITGQENIYFIHDRVQEAFYQRIPEEERSALHQLIGFEIEERNKTNIDTVLFDLAHHFTQGKMDEKALEYSLKAGRKAQQNYSNTLAITLYTTAKNILEEEQKTTAPEYLDLLENLGEVYRLIGKFEESLQVLKACESYILDNDTLRKVQVMSKIANTYFDNGKTEESAKTIESALQMLKVKITKNRIIMFLGIGKEFTVQMLHNLIPGLFVSKQYKGAAKELVIVKMLTKVGQIYYFIDVYKMFYLFLKALNKADKIGPCPEVAYNYVCMGPVMSGLPWLSFSYKYLQRGIRISQQIGYKIGEGVGHAYSGLTFYYDNKPKQGVESAQKSINLLKSVGEFWDLGVGYVFRNFNSFTSGRLKEVVAATEEMYTVSKTANTLQPLGWGLYQRSKAYALQGVFTGQYINDLKESYRLLKIVQDKPNIMHSLTMLAYVYLLKGDLENAVKTIEESATLFSTHYNKGAWSLEVLPVGAQIYLDTIINASHISSVQRKHYLSRARRFVFQSRKWSVLYKYFNGWTHQVWGTYNWLCGRKKRAERIWDRGLHWLRTNKNNPGGDKYRIAYLLLEEAKFLLEDNPQSKKAYTNLTEARELFEEMGCVLDLETTKKFLEKIVPEGTVIDSREILTSKRHLESLLNVSQAIGSIFNLNDLLDKIIEYALTVTGAERGFLLLYSSDNDVLELKTSRGLEKEFQNLSFSYDEYKISLELIKNVESRQEGQLIVAGGNKEQQIEAELKMYQVKQALAVPLKTKERLVGVIYLDNRLAGGTFGNDELELMKALSVQAAISIENTRLVGSMVEQERLRQEMELGRDIQKNLLPQAAPQVNGLKVTGLMLPAKEIGGDYYDFLQLSGRNKLGIVIGDVSGKGVGAGLIMATAKSTIEAITRQNLTPKEILTTTNELLTKYTKGEKFMTMLYMEWDWQQKNMRYSSAGHEHIIIYRCNGTPASVEVIPSGGIVLGMLPDTAQYLEDKEIVLNPGDKIVLYTDGITEAHNVREELFTLERLVSAVQKHGDKEIDTLVPAIKDEVFAFIGSAEQFDDITLVAMEMM